MDIIITEKPSVAREYEKALQVKKTGNTNGYIQGFSPVLNQDVQITWAVGHLCSLDTKAMMPAGKWELSRLPILPKNFVYQVNAQTQAQFNVISSLYNQSNIGTIYYAGDSGREGIYIQATIRNMIFHHQTPSCNEKVVWIDSYTTASIINGIKTAKPYTDYLPMIASGYERAYRDWLFGMNYTEAISVASKQFSAINTGRVMTPTLGMIVDRQREIDAFTSSTTYNIKAGNAECDHAPFPSEALAKQFISTLGKDYTVTNVTTEHKRENPPYLFNLADLQAHCAKEFHLSPAKTLEYAQSLYEGKYITYPRSDARVLSSAVAKDFEKQGITVPQRYVNDEWITDHYAIIPVNHKASYENLPDMQKNVYKAILKRFTDIFLPAYEYDAHTVFYDNNGVTFKENLKSVTVPGFHVSEQPNKAVLPFVGSVHKFTPSVTKTTSKPPKPFTTGTLITAMEKAGKLVEDKNLQAFIKGSGIGTSATRAGIIEKLQSCGFITVDKKQKVTPTDKGKEVIDITRRFLPDITSVDCTAKMESELSQIAENKLSADIAHKTFEDMITNNIMSLKKKLVVKAPKLILS